MEKQLHTQEVEVYALVDTDLYKGPDEETVGVYGTLKEMKDAFYTRLSYSSDPQYAVKRWDEMMKSPIGTVEIEPNCFLNCKKVKVSVPRTLEEVHCLTDICGFVSVHRTLADAHKRFVNEFTDPLTPDIIDPDVEKKWNVLLEKGMVEIKAKYIIQHPSGEQTFVPAMNMYYNKSYLV